MKIFYAIQFVFFYLYKLVQSNLYIAYDILTPTMKNLPGQISVPVHIRSDFGILLFSNLLSMTPGTLSIDLSDDKRELQVHYLTAGSRGELLHEIEQIQFRIKKIFN